MPGCLTGPLSPPLSPRRESVVSLKRKYLQHDADEGVSLSQPSMDGLLDAIAEEGCSSLLEEVFLDLEVGAAGRVPWCGAKERPLQEVLETRALSRLQGRSWYRRGDWLWPLADCCLRARAGLHARHTAGLGFEQRHRAQP